MGRLAPFKPSTKVASVSSDDRTGADTDGVGGQLAFVRNKEDGLG
jgi:hypothetical protein